MEYLQANYIKDLLPLITQYSLKILGALVVILITFWLATKAKTLSVKVMRKAKTEETLVRFFGNMAKWSVLALAGVSLLGYFGFQTASFAALLAAAGLAVGLAFQGTLSNFAAGVMLLLFRPFKVDQYVKVAGVEGNVVEIGIFTTAIDTLDLRRIILPNSSVFGATIENVSHHKIRRVDIAVGTSYDADLDKTKETLKKVIEKTEGILSEPAPTVVLTGLGSSSVDWAIRVFAVSEDYWAVRERLLWASKRTLDESGIGIPYPQLDVHLNNPTDSKRT